MNKHDKLVLCVVLMKVICIIIMFAVVMAQDYQIKVLEACLSKPNLPECAELQKER